VFALVVTLLFALYVLGPDLLSRWTLGFIVQRRNLVQTKSEEVTRAVIWAVFPLLFAYWWASHHGGLWTAGTLDDVKTFFSGIYSESFFLAHRAEFYHATHAIILMNYCVLWRLYAIVVLVSVTLNAVILNYGRIRHALGAHVRLKTLLATIVLPRVSDWHLLLSKMLLHSQSLDLQIDILTKNGIMYQGRFADKVLAPDGSLVSITLDQPRRFRREEFVEERKKNPSIASEDFWREIPGNIFVILAADVSSLNLRYTPKTVLPWIQSAEFRAIVENIQKLLRSRSGGQT
jgi:hypothetical protein